VSHLHQQCTTTAKQEDAFTMDKLDSVSRGGLPPHVSGR
jgi:hypothetical protein